MCAKKKNEKREGPENKPAVGNKKHESIIPKWAIGVVIILTAVLYFRSFLTDLLYGMMTAI